MSKQSVNSDPASSKGVKSTAAMLPVKSSAVAKTASSNAVAAKTVADKAMTKGQQAYEAKRAAKAGVSLDKWMSMKAREREAEEKAAAKAAKAEAPKKPGFFSRLIERAHKPL